MLGIEKLCNEWRNARIRGVTFLVRPERKRDSVYCSMP